MMLHPASSFAAHLFPNNRKVGIIIEAISEVGRMPHECLGVPPLEVLEAAVQIHEFNSSSDM